MKISVKSLLGLDLPSNTPSLPDYSFSGICHMVYFMESPYSRLWKEILYSAMLLWGWQRAHDLKTHPCTQHRVVPSVCVRVTPVCVYVLYECKKYIAA